MSHAHIYIYYLHSRPLNRKNHDHLSPYQWDFPFLIIFHIYFIYFWASYIHFIDQNDPQDLGRQETLPASQRCSCLRRRAPSAETVELPPAVGLVRSTSGTDPSGAVWGLGS